MQKIIIFTLLIALTLAFVHVPVKKAKLSWPEKIMFLYRLGGLDPFTRAILEKFIPSD